MDTILPKECGCPDKEHPLVSVIIPVYNGEKFIDSCLDSIARQTYLPIEIIVVNDGSTDTSAVHAKNHGAGPVIVNIPHSNLPSARNAGIRRARGDYIAFCDVDDLWLPEKLERQVEHLNAHPDVGLVFTAIATIGAKGDKPKKRGAELPELDFNRGDQFAILVRKSIIVPSSVMVRRSVVDLVGFFDETLFSCEDWDWWIRVARLAIRMHRMGAPLTLYRRHGGNMSKKIEVMHRSRLQVLDKAFKGLDETPRLLRLKNRAMAMAFFEAANGFYSSGDLENFRECYRKARRFGPASLSPKAMRRFIKDKICGKSDTVINQSKFDRIILLVDEFPPAIAGGIATWALVFSEDLERRGHKVVVMAPRKLLKRAPRADCRAEVRYIGWHDWAKYRGIYSFLGVLPLLLQGKRLLIVGSTWQHLTVIARVRKIINARIICFSHGTDATRAITPPRRARFKGVLQRTDLFAPTSAFLDTLVKKSFPDVALKSVLVYNGIDISHFRPMEESKSAFRATLGINPSAIVIVSAGRLIPAKGFDTLIAAVGKAGKIVPAMHLYIAGARDEEYPRLKRICADSGLTGRVTFSGRIPYDKLPEFYNAADIGVLASVPLHEPYYIEDNFPLMLLEAAGCGLPVVGTICGGIPEIIEDAKCGYLVAPFDSDRLAQRLVELAQDSGLRKTMGNAARLRVMAHFSREKMVEVFLDGARTIV